jgi:adenylate cyclase
MKARLAGIASHVGMSDVFRLRGADVYAVLDVRCVVGEPAAQPRGDALLSSLRAGLPLPRNATDFPELIDELLLLATRPGFAHCMLLSADEQRRRLSTVGSTGYPATGVGAEIAWGAGVIGVAARERMPIRITHMARDYLYGSVVRDQCKAPGDVGLAREIPLPGLADSRSQLALPIVGDGRLPAVLYIESLVDGGIPQVDEEACAVPADQFADSWLRLSSLEQQAANDPADAAAKATVEGEPLLVSHDPSDHSVFIDNESLIKGVAGAVPWRMLGDFVGSQRVVFTNRELRRDPRLGLPEVADNLEARLVLLQRRLAERRPGGRAKGTMACAASAAARLRTMRRGGGPRVVGPRMPGIAPLQLLLHFRIGAFPEAAQILRDLDRNLARRQQVQQEWHAATRDAWRVGETEHLLQLDREHGCLADRVAELAAHAARYGDLRRREFVDGPRLRVIESCAQDAGEFAGVDFADAQLARRQHRQPFVHRLAERGVPEIGQAQFRAPRAQAAHACLPLAQRGSPRQALEPELADPVGQDRCGLGAALGLHGALIEDDAREASRALRLHRARLAIETQLPPRAEMSRVSLFEQCRVQRRCALDQAVPFVIANLGDGEPGFARQR